MFLGLCSKYQVALVVDLVLRSRVSFLLLANCNRKVWHYMHFLIYIIIA